MPTTSTTNCWYILLYVHIAIIQGTIPIPIAPFLLFTIVTPIIISHGSLLVFTNLQYLYLPLELLDFQLSVLQLLIFIPQFHLIYLLFLPLSSDLPI